MAGGRILGASFPSFRRLAAPWAKSYDGRRGPMAASAGCFVAEAARTRNPKTPPPERIRKTSNVSADFNFDSPDSPTVDRN
jgi:hypothetical protein